MPKKSTDSEHHARLFVNSAMTMADFILAVDNRAS
ncbi:abortive infection family protein [Dehalobacter sp. TeCB1]|nr:abortive infection family protein [Dehalobacter sp. TeCB1]